MSLYWDVSDMETPFANPDDCEACGALWRHHTLSAERPLCECGSRICLKCDATGCETCGRLIHLRCSHLIGNEHFCQACWTYELREAVKECDLETKLQASLYIWAKERTA